MTVAARDVATMSHAEIVDEIKALQPKLGKAFEEMGADYDASKITVLEGDTASKSRQVFEINERLGVLMEKSEEFTKLDAAKARVERAGAILDTPRGPRIVPSDGDGGGGEPAPPKSIGSLIVESKAFTERGEADTVQWGGAEVKSDFLTSAGWAPESVRSGRLVLSAQRGIKVLDMLPIIPESQAAYVYMKETTFTNNAAETDEGDAYGEAALALTEVTELMHKIAVFLPTSDEQMRYVSQAEAYINARLPFMLRQRLDSQVLVGAGGGTDITGFLNTASVQTHAKGSDPVFDAIFKGITKCETVGQAEADGIVMHPTDWQGVRLTRTADGVYILGNPDASADKRLFGLPVATSTAETLGTVLTGAFQGFSALIMGPGLEVKMSDSHSDYFAKGKLAIRATMYATLAVFRPQAFCMVTGV